MRGVALRPLVKDPGEQGPFCLSIGTDSMHSVVDTQYPRGQEWLRDAADPIAWLSLYWTAGWLAATVAALGRAQSEEQAGETG